MHHSDSHYGVTDVLQLSARGFTRLAGYITDELGIKMPESKLSMIQSRLVRRVRELGLRSLEDYADYFFSSGQIEEREHLINAITTNKTDFFREPEHFQFLVDTVLPARAGARTYDHACIRMWSAACSSGEEPYTLAMVLSQFALERPNLEFAILATDISSRMLQKARNAIYAEEQVVPVPGEMRKRYLMRSKTEPHLVRIVPQLRQKVCFHLLNFMAADYSIESTFDVIFLRNVLIYFDKRTQEAVVKKVCRYLEPGGYLFVGHSESLSELEVPVTRVRTSIYQRPR